MSPTYASSGFVHRHAIFCVCGIISISVGCSRYPERVKVPGFDPEASAEAALQAYDTDKDGQLSKSELEKCPGILAARSSFDLNKDGFVSGQEISDRVQMYIDRGAGLKMVGCKVFLDKRPLGGVQVDLIPEEFLGGVVEEASGTSRNGGFVPLTIPPDKLPADLAGVQGVRLGIYRVKISDPRGKLPERYTTGNELGVEIGPSSSVVFLQLKSK